MKNNIIQEKSIKFSVRTIHLFQKLQSEKEYVISTQLLRSSTSVGANIHEAIEAESKKDFIHKMSIALKEARETQYWLIVLQKSNLVQFESKSFKDELNQILKLLIAIIKTSKQRL